MKEISLKDLCVSDCNVRRAVKLDTEDFEGLAGNIEVQSLICPLVVRPSEDDKDKYEIVVGQRRYWAMKSAGAEKAPCIVVELTDNEAIVKSLSENLFREDLDPIDRATAVERLHKAGYTRTQIGNMMGVTPATISSWLVPLRQHPKVTQLVREGKISRRVAERLVLFTNTGEEQVAVATEIAKAGVSDHDMQEVFRVARKEGLTPAQVIEIIKKTEGEPVIKTVKTLNECVVSFPPRMFKRMEALCDERGMKETDLIRTAIKFYLEREGY